MNRHARERLRVAGLVFAAVAFVAAVTFSMYRLAVLSLEAWP